MKGRFTGILFNVVLRINRRPEGEEGRGRKSLNQLVNNSNNLGKEQCSFYQGDNNRGDEDNSEYVC